MMRQLAVLESSRLKCVRVMVESPSLTRYHTSALMQVDDTFIDDDSNMATAPDGIVSAHSLTSLHLLLDVKA